MGIYKYIYILYISIQCSKHAHEVQCNTYGAFSKICEYNYSVPLLSSEMIPWNKRIWKGIWFQLHQEVALCNKLVNMAKIELFYTFVKILVYLWLKSTRKTNLHNLHNSFEINEQQWTWQKPLNQMGYVAPKLSETTWKSHFLVTKI